LKLFPPFLKKKQVIDSKLSANPNDQDKRVVVLLAPKVKEPLTIDSVQTQSSGGVSNKSPQIYVVTTGDTLIGISTKYNIKISALRRWNNLAGNKKIRINDKLHLIAPETVNK
jgi:LysM repeat protein